MKNPKIIASLISESVDVSPEQLLRQFINNNESIYYEPFRIFCESQGIVVEPDEFIDLLEADRVYTYNEYSDANGRYWVPAIIEGYVSNVLPGDWDDFGDDQIDGITKPAFGDGSQQQPMDFDILSGVDIEPDNPNIDPDRPATETEEPNVELEDPDLPDFDTRVRHRPSRSVKELE